MKKTCPCGTKKEYSQCCEPFHSLKSKPETAEQLMRSRYSAYVVGCIDYIDQTNEPDSHENFDRNAAENWSKKSEWLGLEIIATQDGQEKDQTGEVEFKAHFKTHDSSGIDTPKETIHHEVSLFKRHPKTKAWFYADGKEILAPLQRTGPKLGRNDPCHCGSGKKLKKCCG